MGTPSTWRPGRIEPRIEATGPAGERVEVGGKGGPGLVSAVGVRVSINISV